MVSTVWAAAKGWQSGSFGKQQELGTAGDGDSGEGNVGK